MKRFSRLLCLLGGLAVLLPAAALAQLSGTGDGRGVASPGGSAAGGAGGIHPRRRVPDFAPPAVPGAGGPALATTLPVPKADTGNPTTELFTAVNSGDYNAAQDAVSRGADISAQNELGETPLDLSIALNRNTITFMLLSARNEGAQSGPVGAPWTLTPPTPTATARGEKHGKFKMIPAAMDAPPRQMPGDDPGTPNPGVGFLGFNQNR